MSPRTPRRYRPDPRTSGGGIEADKHQRLVAVVAARRPGIIHPIRSDRETAARLPATGDFFLKAARTPGVVSVSVKVADQKGQRPQAVVRPGPDVDGVFWRQNPQVAALSRGAAGGREQPGAQLPAECAERPHHAHTPHGWSRQSTPDRRPRRGRTGRGGCDRQERYGRGRSS